MSGPGPSSITSVIYWSCRLGPIVFVVNRDYRECSGCGLWALGEWEVVKSQAGCVTELPSPCLLSPISGIQGREEQWLLATITAPFTSRNHEPVLGVKTSSNQALVSHVNEEWDRTPLLPTVAFSFREEEPFYGFHMCNIKEASVCNLTREEPLVKYL